MSKNTEQFNIEEERTGSMGRNKASTSKKLTTSKSPRAWRIVAVLVLLIILFLILAAITISLCKYYWEMNEEMSHLINLNLKMREEMSRLNNSNLEMREEMSLLNNSILENSEKMSCLKNSDIICTPCPAGWSMSGCSCYYVSEDSTTWDQARDKCKEMKSVLVMVKDQTESDTLNKLYKMDRRYWIGLRRNPENSLIWKWLDGTEVTFNNWDKDQPDNLDNKENCGESRPGPWNDIHCDDNLLYICKK